MCRPLSAALQPAPRGTVNTTSSLLSPPLREGNAQRHCGLKAKPLIPAGFSDPFPWSRQEAGDGGREVGSPSLLCSLGAMHRAQAAARQAVPRPADHGVLVGPWHREGVEAGATSETLQSRGCPFEPQGPGSGSALRETASQGAKTLETWPPRDSQEPASERLGVQAGSSRHGFLFHFSPHNRGS